MIYDLFYNVETAWVATVTRWLLISLIPLGLIYARQGPVENSVYIRTFWMTFVFFFMLMVVTQVEKNHIFDGETGYLIKQYEYQHWDVWDDEKKVMYPVDKYPTYSSDRAWKAPDGTLAPYPLAKRISFYHECADYGVFYYWTFLTIGTIILLVVFFTDATKLGVSIFAGSAATYGVGKTVGGDIGESLQGAGKFGMGAIFMVFILCVLASYVLIPALAIYIFLTTYGKDFLFWLFPKLKQKIDEWTPKDDAQKRVERNLEKARQRQNKDAEKSTVTVAEPPKLVTGCGIHGRSKRTR